MENESMNETADSDKLDTSRSSASEDSSTLSPRAKVPYALHINLDNKENEKGDKSNKTKPTTPNARSSTGSSASSNSQSKSSSRKPQTPTDSASHILRAPYAQPILDASKLHNTSDGGGDGSKKSSTIEERLASARERRMQQQKQLELDLKSRREREDQAHMKWLQGQEEKRRKIEENKMKDGQHRKEVEMRKKQQLEEDKKKAEAKIARTEQVYEVKMRQKRSSSSDRGNKRWSWGGDKAHQRPRSMHASHFDVSQLGRLFDDNSPDPVRAGSMTNLASPSASKPQSDRFSKSPLLINTTHLNFAMGLRTYEPHTGAGRGVSPDSPRIRRSNSLGARPKPSSKGPPSRTASVENIAPKKDDTPSSAPKPTSSKTPRMRGRSPAPKVTLTTTAKIREQLAKNQKAASAGRPTTAPGLTEPITISPRLLAPTRASLARSRNAINELDDSASQSSNTSGGHSGPMRSRSKDRRTKEKAPERSDSGSSSPMPETSKSSPSVRKPTPDRKSTPNRGSAPVVPNRRAPSPAQTRGTGAKTTTDVKKTATPEAAKAQKRGNSPAARRSGVSPACKPKPSTPTGEQQTTPQRSTSASSKRGVSPSPVSGTRMKSKPKSETSKATSTPPNIKPALRPTNSTQIKAARSSPATKATTKTEKPTTPKAKTPDTSKQSEKPKPVPKESQKPDNSSQNTDSGFKDISDPIQQAPSVPNSVGAILTPSVSGEIPKSLSNTSQSVSEIPSASEILEKDVEVETEPAIVTKVGSEMPEKNENAVPTSEPLSKADIQTSDNLPHGTEAVENDLSPEVQSNVGNNPIPHVQSTVEDELSPQIEPIASNDLPLQGDPKTEMPQEELTVTTDIQSQVQVTDQDDLSPQAQSSMENDFTSPTTLVEPAKPMDSVIQQEEELVQDDENVIEEGDAQNLEPQILDLQPGDAPITKDPQALDSQPEPILAKQDTSGPNLIQESESAGNDLMEFEMEMQMFEQNRVNNEDQNEVENKNIEQSENLPQMGGNMDQINFNEIIQSDDQQPDSLENPGMNSFTQQEEEKVVDMLPENQDSLLDSFKTVEPQDPRAISPTDSLEEFEPEPDLPENTQEPSIDYLPPDNFDSESSSSDSEEQVSVKENVPEDKESSEKSSEQAEMLESTEVEQEKAESAPETLKLNEPEEILAQKDEEEKMEKQYDQSEKVATEEPQEAEVPALVSQGAAENVKEEVESVENQTSTDVSNETAEPAPENQDDKVEMVLESQETADTAPVMDENQVKEKPEESQQQQQSSEGESPPTSESTPAERKSQPRKALETEADKEAYRQAIAEKRRELKEKKEQEERERKERIRLAKIESQKREEEARKMFEEAAAEAEREKKEQEERELRKIEEEKRKEEEAIARKEAEKREAAEKIKREREAQKQKQEDERLARKKRLEMIMRRTRQPDASTDGNKSRTDGSLSPAGTPSPQHTPTTQSPASGRSPQTESPVGGKSPITATTPERSVSPAVAAILNRSSNNYSPTTTMTSQSNNSSPEDNNNHSSNEQTLINFSNSTPNYDQSEVELIKIDTGIEPQPLSIEKPTPIEAFATVKPISNGMKNEENQSSINDMDPFNLFSNGNMDLQQSTNIQVNNNNGNQDLMATNNDGIKISPEPLVPTGI